MFFASFFLPALGLLIDGEFQYAAIVLAAIVFFIFVMGSIIDKMPDTLFVAFVMIGANIGGLTYGLISGFTGGITIICLQWLIYFIVTIDFITDLHNDIHTVVQHKDDLYDECKRIEESDDKA